MPAKPESSFILSVNRRLPLKGVRSSAAALARHPVEEHIHYEKMANPWRGGTWDSWYSGRGGDLWVEYKWIARVPQRASVKPATLLSALQVAWGNERYDEGRSVAVIIGCPAGGVLLCDREWTSEIPAQEFQSRLYSREDVAAWIFRVVTGKNGATL